MVTWGRSSPVLPAWTPGPLYGLHVTSVPPTCPPFGGSTTIRADPFSFFAVQVGVVRIGDSAMAPVFEIRERPSEWDRRIRDLSTETLSEIARFRRDFWAFYSGRHPNDLDLRPGFRNSNTYDRVEELEVWISQFLAPSSNEVGIYVVGQNEESIEAVQQRLRPYEDRVREELGIQLIGSLTTRHFALLVMGNIEPMDRDNWERIADWFP